MSPPAAARQGQVSPPAAARQGQVSPPAAARQHQVSPPAAARQGQVTMGVRIITLVIDLNTHTKKSHLQTIILT